MTQKFDERNVFLNFPFDKSFEPLLIALVAALVSIGRKPRSVLQVPQAQANRLERLAEAIAACPVSIHDMSFLGAPVRFNMPFECGLAFGLQLFAQPKGSHVVLMMERQRHRLWKTLSDVAGRDHIVHARSQRLLITGILAELGTGATRPPVPAVLSMCKPLAEVARQHQKDNGTKDVFNPLAFAELVTQATVLATALGLIPA